MPVSRPDDDAARLQAEIDRARDTPVIVVWIRHKPRVATLRPVAESLLEAGFTVFVGYSPGLQTTREAMKFSESTPCYEIRPQSAWRLKNVAVFITSEQDTRDGPPTAKRVGIHHSLPDKSLRRNYAKMLMVKPVAALETDYYAILSTQEPHHWTVENYLPYVDRLLPAAPIRHRRKTMAIVPFGYPKIDRMMAQDPGDAAPDTITYAPTQTILQYSSVLKKGPEILDMLLTQFPAYRIVFRPYPGLDVERTRGVWEKFLHDPRFSLDDTVSGEETLRRTALLITDQSSVAVSFGLGMARPVIFYNADGNESLGFKDLDYFPPIGLRAGSMQSLRQGTAQMLSNTDRVAERIRQRRAKFIYNPGNSLGYLVGIMPDIIAGGTRTEWLEVPRRPYRAWTRAARLAHLDRLLERLGRAYPEGVAVTDKALRPGFSATPLSRLRRLAGRSVRKIPGLRRYLSRPRGRT